MQTVRAARRDMYYPIFYIEPLEQHRAAVGFNLGSVPSYMEAMQKALSTEGAVASAWRSVAQDTGEQFGFLLFVPIYKNGVPHRTFEERRMSLQGFTMAMFRLDTLVEQSLRGLALGTMGLELADVTDAASKYLLSLQLDASRVASFTFVPRQSAQTEAIRAGAHWETTFTIAGRTWSMLFHPMPEARHTYARQEWGDPRRRAAVHAALCWLLHPEGEIVSPGIDIAGYLAGGDDAAVPAQRNRAPGSGTSRSTYRVETVCRLAFHPALGTGLRSCASGLNQSA